MDPDHTDFEMYRRDLAYHQKRLRDMVAEQSRYRISIDGATADITIEEIARSRRKIAELTALLEKGNA